MNTPFDRSASAKLKDIRLLVQIGDTHCGSTFGLCPPNFVLEEGQIVRTTAFQQWLWEQWLDTTQRVLPTILGDDPWALIGIGDLMEGVHHGTTQVVSPDPALHTAIAKACFLPLADKCDRLYVVKGTKAHVGTANEEGVSLECGGERDPHNGRPAWWKLRMTVHGTACRFTHHIGTTKRTYLESGELGRELAEEQLRAARAGRVIPRVIGRAHRHVFGHYDSGHGQIVVSPAWQGNTEFVHKVIPSNEEAVVGLVVYDWRGKDAGDDPTVHKILRKQPPIAGVE